MKLTVTEKRKEKIINAAKNRQFSLHLVLENIHDPHNVSAIFRSCDAVGVPNVSLIYNYEKFPKIGKKSSASAFKWVEKVKYKTVDECFNSLRSNGFKIYTTAITENAVSLYDLDFTEKCAIVLGNEHRGVSDEAIKHADKCFSIPMYGFVQSLNVSVAAAVILYETQRQRLLNGKYGKSELNENDLENLIFKWITKK